MKQNEVSPARESLTGQFPTCTQGIRPKSLHLGLGSFHISVCADGKPYGDFVVAYIRQQFCSHPFNPMDGFGAANDETTQITHQNLMVGAECANSPTVFSSERAKRLLTPTPALRVMQRPDQRGGALTGSICPLPVRDQPFRQKHKSFSGCSI